METLPSLQDNQVGLLISQAIDKNVSVEALEKLLAMRREWRLEVAEEEFNIAMTGFQSECPIIQKTKKVYGKSGYLYSYAPIESILHQVRPIMVKYNFSYSIQSITEEKYVEAICVVYHIRGHSRSTSFRVPIDMGEMTAAMTKEKYITGRLMYCSRYAFRNAFGITTGDVDSEEEVIEDKVEYITDGQINDLLITIRETEYKLEDILKGQKVDSLDKVTKKNAGIIISRLYEYIERNKSGK